MIRPCGRNIELLNDPTAAVNGFLMIDKTCNGMRYERHCNNTGNSIALRTPKLKQKATEKTN